VDPGAGQPATPAAAKDETPPLLRLRAARAQDVLRRGRVGLSIVCDEKCVARVSARAGGLSLRGVLTRLAAGKRATIELRASARVRRALQRRGAVVVKVRARDSAGNLATKSLTVRVRRQN
jgi:hypothetical protein